jgi:hypothetical protein
MIVTRPKITSTELRAHLVALLRDELDETKQEAFSEVLEMRHDPNV